MPPTIRAKNGFAGSCELAEYSGQLPGMQAEWPDCAACPGQHVSAV